MNVRAWFLILAAFVLLSYQNTADATLKLVLTQGIKRAIPIAVVPFSGQGENANDPNNIAAVIHHDLQFSGQFNALPIAQMQQFPSKLTDVDFSYWKGKSVDAIVIGSVKPLAGNRFDVKFALLDVYQGLQYEKKPLKAPILVSKAFIVSANQMRKLAHNISDIIYQQLTGVHGIFSTRIAYVLVKPLSGENRHYSLEIADADGYNPRAVLKSNAPIMAPAWSPDGRKVAYVSFEHNRAGIYVQNVMTGQRQSVSHYSGINGAPAWSPDGKKLALVLSKSGNVNIYALNLQTQKLTQITHDWAIDTEPSWSPKGQSLVFTSNRAGGPQIYEYNFATQRTRRLTFDGNYNATPSFTPDGKNIILLHERKHRFNIASLDLSSGAITQLTFNEDDNSPSVAPNGQMIIFANQNGDKGVLGIVSRDGKIKLRLPAPEGSVKAPAWSPFLS